MPLLSILVAMVVYLGQTNQGFVTFMYQVQNVNLVFGVLGAVYIGHSFYRLSKGDHSVSETSVWQELVAVPVAFLLAAGSTGLLISQSGDNFDGMKVVIGAVFYVISIIPALLLSQE